VGLKGRKRKRGIEKKKSDRERPMATSYFLSAGGQGDPRPEGNEEGRETNWRWGHGANLKKKATFILGTPFTGNQARDPVSQSIAVETKKGGGSEEKLRARQSFLGSTVF